MKNFLYNIVSRLVAPRAEAQLATVPASNTLAVVDHQASHSSFKSARKSRDTTEYVIGEELTGIVSGIEHYGIFVRLPNGESGLVFQNEICWPDEDIAYDLGDKVSVMVLGFKAGRGLALSIRETRVAAAFDDFTKTHAVGSVVKARIKSVKDYGLFVHLAPGVSGLLHVSAIPNIQIYGKFSIGESIEVCVVDIEQSTRRISLELK